MNQWTRKRKKKERGGEEGEEGRAEGYRGGKNEVEEEERKTKKKSRSLESRESLTSARLIIIINSNLGISPPEGTSRLHREGRAHGGEANVVKAGCS